MYAHLAHRRRAIDRATFQSRAPGDGGGRAGAAALVLAASVILSGVASAPDARADGLSFESADGEHKVGLSLTSRARAEGWDAHAANTDWFVAVRTRVGARYQWRDRLSAFAEFQDARINGLDTSAENARNGAAGAYLVHGGFAEETHSDRIRQLWLELAPIQGLKLRVGRQDIKLGTEVLYPEANWRYLKIARLSQRLVGTVGWTHVERSNDGASLTYDYGDYQFYGFGAKPTTGVFDFNSAYATQNDILYGGFVWTARRGAWIDDTELRLFGIAYEDDRDAPDGAFGGISNDQIRVYTGGLSLLGIYPAGAGNLDLLLWGAYQWGDWYDAPGDQDHQAWAALAEIGYQFTEASMKPWIRCGINIASGDGSATDGDHESFFNLLPTNHLYYGFADRFALANLIDYFLQLRLNPTEKLGLNLFLHHFQLYTTDDGRHAGTGAFNKTSFGYSIQKPPAPFSTHRSLGTEVDVVVDYNLHPRLSLQAGYSFMEGHAMFDSSPPFADTDEDVRFAYFQITAKY